MVLQRLIVRPFVKDEIAELYLSYNKNCEEYPFLEPSPISVDSIVSTFESEGLLSDFSGQLAIEVNSKVVGFGSFRPLEKHIIGLIVGLAICDPSAWNLGFGSEALVELSRFLFESQRAARLEWKTVSSHKAAIRVAEKAGFRHEGISRSATLLRGAVCDVTRLSMLVGDFEGQRGPA